MAEQLSGGNVALALLANTLATVGGLYVLIEVFGPVSGAHFNPAVSAVMAWRGGALPWSALPSLRGGAAQRRRARAWLAHGMFDLPVWQLSPSCAAARSLWLAEGVATFGLVLVILHAPAGRAPAMVAGYIGAAYWFTASTLVCQPGRRDGAHVQQQLAGIAPASAPAFVVRAVGGRGTGRACGILADRRPPRARWPAFDEPPPCRHCPRAVADAGLGSSFYLPALLSGPWRRGGPQRAHRVGGVLRLAGDRPSRDPAPVHASTAGGSPGA